MKRMRLSGIRGTSALGYALTVGLIAVVAIGAVAGTGGGVSALFGSVEDNLSDIPATDGGGHGGGGGAHGVTACGNAGGGGSCDNQNGGGGGGYANTSVVTVTSSGAGTGAAGGNTLVNGSNGSVSISW
jgi:Flp pilus assembly pilin Flp